MISFRKRKSKQEKKDLEKDLERLGLTDNQKRIFFEIKSNRNITQKDLSLKIGISEKNIRNNIADLKEMGIVKRVGPDKGGYWEVKNIKN